MTYFTTQELRALPDMDDTARFPDARLQAAHDWIVSVIEREADTQFVATSVTETVNGSGRDSLFLSASYVQSVEAVSVNGIALTSDELAALVLQNGILYRSDTCWSAASRGNVVVTYTSGVTVVPPADLKEAALRGARNWLLTSDAWSGADSRATSIANDFGNIQIAVAGPDRPTGWPDVDATILAWARRVRVPKVS